MCVCARGRVHTLFIIRFIDLECTNKREINKGGGQRGQLVGS